MENETGAAPLDPIPENAKASESKSTILIVDDSMLARSMLIDILESQYDFIEAADGYEAVSALQKHGTKISLVLLDINMPNMDGFEVLEVMNKNQWMSDIPVIMISSETDQDYVVKAYDLGVSDFINRPYDANIVRRRVNNTIMLYAKQKTLVGLVADQMLEREKSNNIMVSVLSHIVEFRNGESGLHVLHVSTVTELLLKQIASKTPEYGLSPQDISRIAMASSLHDIGKISIPDEILNKPGKLTDEEFELMKTHSMVGAEMLSNVPAYQDEPLIKSAYEITRWHHERYDGGGYPDHLVGDEIPISAQAVSLADVYDALTSERVYKKAFSHEKAMEMIKNGECGVFNPFLLECFEEIADEIPEKLNSASLAQASEHEILKLVENSIDLGGSHQSSHTLGLLDYENSKYDFYASISNEIQYEYIDRPSLLVLSDWGARKLGLPEMIADPYDDSAAIRIFGVEAVQKFHDELHSTTIDDPVVQMSVLARIKDEPKWFQVTAHANWNAETGEYLGSYGKLVDIHEEHRHIADLEFKVTHDPLTGLLNRSSAVQLAKERMEIDKGKTFIFIILDISGFRGLNVSKGRKFGDRLLLHMAQRLEGRVRGNDIVARVGGDEFFVCMESDNDAETLVERVYESASGTYEGVDVSVCMGVACCVSQETTFDALFSTADDALLEYKKEHDEGYVIVDELKDPGDTGSCINSIDEGNGDES